MHEEFEFVRLVGNERRVGTALASVSRHWQANKESFLFVSPHDDVALGAGLLIQLAQREKVPVNIIIVTDGSMGYSDIKEQDTIARIRREETFDCYQRLGVPKENIVWLGFPDCQLAHYRGRRPSETKTDMDIEDCIGLQNTFTHHLRRVNPTQCFLPTCNDLHPDHQIVYDEFLISVFHAGGDIWPELGKPLARVPYVHEIAVYCDFLSRPTLRMQAPISYLETKLQAIGAFRSQKQISSLVENVRNGGPQEYIKAIEFALYHPAKYHDIFEEKKTITPTTMR
jgi:LmbE family N-acetylglucosaminyl deacetylase